MNDDDDEMAKAAILLAHTPPDEPMTAELERRILAASAAARGTTTKAGALELPTPCEAPAPTSLWRGLAPWLAAAACVAFFVFRWRTASLEQAEVERGLAARGITITIALRTADGAEHGSLVWARERLRGELTRDAALREAGELSVWGRAANGGIVSLGICPAAGDDGPCPLSSPGALVVPEEIWANGPVTAAPDGATVDTGTPPPLLTTGPVHPH